MRKTKADEPTLLLTCLIVDWRKCPIRPRSRPRLPIPVGQREERAARIRSPQPPLSWRPNLALERQIRASLGSAFHSDSDNKSGCRFTDIVVLRIGIIRVAAGKWISLVLAVAIVGCSHRAGVLQTKLTSVRLEDFSGVYTNHSGHWQLTSVVMPKTNDAWTADTIKVQVEGKSVAIAALKQGRTICERTFQEGKDFHLRNSQISADKSASGRVAHLDEGFIFPAIPGPLGSFFSGKFFLNRDRDLVYSTSENTYQLSFYFLPTAGSSKEDVVFKRLPGVK